jgi:hypothetical protein
VVERRLLVNYRVDPAAAAGLVPAPFRPQVVDGCAVAGVCLIRLGHVRPVGLPRVLGRSSENAAHRVAVEWDTPDGPACGVYITRRDTNALVNTLVGGRLFPGEHHRARFRVDERSDEVRVAFDSLDGDTSVDVRVAPASRFDSGLFPDLAAASDFFQAGSVGYSPARGGSLDGLELCTSAWRVEPVQVVSARSSFFDAGGPFPPGSAELDCALLMRDVPVTWRPLPR